MIALWLLLSVGQPYPSLACTFREWRAGSRRPSITLDPLYSTFYQRCTFSYKTHTNHIYPLPHPYVLFLGIFDLWFWNDNTTKQIALGLGARPFSYAFCIFNFHEVTTERLLNS